ncbi:serine hydrolase [Leucobacter chromiireducens]|uniref:serine hydrolase n=1 Tax=Leucobacter chromiireducens TaxID=283877 RepID=UPI0019293036|nr:serine hydrolase [Leucobacter chromiireducens]
MFSERPDSGEHGAYSDGIPVLAWQLVVEADAGDGSARAVGFRAAAPFAGDGFPERPDPAARHPVTAASIADWLERDAAWGAQVPGAAEGPIRSALRDGAVEREVWGGRGGLRFHAARIRTGSGVRRVAVVTRAFSAADAAAAAAAICALLCPDLARDQAVPTDSSVAGTHDTAPIATFAVLAAGGEQLAARGSQRVFYAASTIKLGLALAVLRAVDHGALDLDEQVVSQHHFASAVAGAGSFGFTPDEIDAGFPPEGRQVSLAVCLARMIEVSANEGTNMLAQRVGLAAVTAAFGAAGAPTARMTRLIGDYAARERGDTHEASASDLAATMREIIAGTLLSPDSAARLQRHLRAQRFPVLADGFADVREWGSKSGWVTGLRHDVAWFTRNGEDTPTVIAVCTSGFETSAALETIRALGAAAERGLPTAILAATNKGVHQQ